MSLASGLEMARVYIPARQQTQKERERDMACIRTGVDHSLLLAIYFNYHKEGKIFKKKKLITVIVVILLNNIHRQYKIYIFALFHRQGLS